MLLCFEDENFLSRHIIEAKSSERNFDDDNLWSNRQTAFCRGALKISRNCKHTLKSLRTHMCCSRKICLFNCGIHSGRKFCSTWKITISLPSFTYCCCYLSFILNVKSLSFPMHAIRERREKETEE